MHKAGFTSLGAFESLANARLGAHIPVQQVQGRFWPAKQSCMGRVLETKLQRFQAVRGQVWLAMEWTARGPDHEVGCGGQ